MILAKSLNASRFIQSQVRENKQKKKPENIMLQKKEKWSA